MYREDAVYKALEQLIKSAGVSVSYGKVPEDRIDGEIWARADGEAQSILMPEEDNFPSAERAALMLGHEMGHILSGLDSPDAPEDRVKNEAVYDLIGAYLFKLAEMIAGYEQEKWQWDL